MKRVLCLWLPNWPIQRLVVAQPELEAAAILLTKSDRGDHIVACSAAARACGVAVGMPRAEAASLIRREVRTDSEEPGRKGGSWHEAVHNPAADRAELLRLAGLCEAFSPQVGLEDSIEVDRGPLVHSGNLLLDVTGTGRWFGGEERLIERLLATLEERRYLARAVLADTTGAAWGVAHFGRIVQPERSGQVDVLPRRVSGFRIIPAGQTLAALRPLPVEALRLAEPAIALLRQLGISDIESLLRLPRSGLSSRFGQRVPQRLDQALGVVEEVLAPHHPVSELAARWSFEHPSAVRSAIEAGVCQVIEELVRQLEAAGRLALQLELHFVCACSSGSHEVVCGLDLFHPANSAGHFLGLIGLQLERLPLPGPVREITARIPWTTTHHPHQRELFEDGARVRQRELAQLMDRLRSRLGAEAILSPVLLPDAQPECACRWVSAIHGSSDTGENAANMTAVPGPHQRPLRFYDPPRPVRVFAVAQGPPARFRDRQQWREVRQAWGPERIETGWWRGRTVRRDYYRVETTSGHRFWLFRRVDDGQWFLQGVFE